MKKILLTLFIVLPFFLISQTEETYTERSIYGYSFEAPSRDSAFVADLAVQIERMPGVEKVQSYFKPEKEEGYYRIFTVYEGIRGQEKEFDPFDPSLIKSLLIQNKLNPKDFRKFQ